MRAPTLQRWVHFREVGGGLFVSLRERAYVRERGFETITLISNRRFLTISRPSYRPLRPPRLRHHVRVADAVENKLSFCVDIARAVARMFTCPGDVAQLGERLGRIEEVEGSIPFVSTTGFD